VSDKDKTRQDSRGMYKQKCAAVHSLIFRSLTSSFSLPACPLVQIIQFASASLQLTFVLFHMLTHSHAMQIDRTAGCVSDLLRDDQKAEQSGSHAACMSGWQSAR